MEASEYRPQYDNSVQEFLGSMGPWPINERYCLLPTSAKVLATLFTPAPEVFEAPPIIQASGSPFFFNHNVPWLRFADGTERNAAVLAGYWGMPGVPYSQALDYAKKDITDVVEGQ